MTPAFIQALIAHADSVFVGPNGDYASVLEAIRGITAAQARWKPSPAQNSIWQIVEHLIASKEWQIEMLERGKAASPVWIEPSGGEEEWQDTLSRLKDTHQRLNKTFEQVAEDDLLQRPGGPGTPTLLELILSSGPAHEAHHSGQLDYLRGLLS